MSSQSYTPLPARVGKRAFLTTLFGRAHVSKNDAELPAGRTLFVLNVPPRVAPGALAAALEAKAGEVTSVRLSSDGSHAAHIVFAEPSGLKKALAANSKPLDLAVSADGAAADAEEPSSRAELQESVGAFMQQFEADEAARKAEEEARHNQMDSDGFVVVTRKRTGRSTSTDATGATVGVATAGMQRQYAEAADDESGGGAAEGGGGGKRKKKRPKEMQDFYHFQQHERKRKDLEKLREQFEADKARIAKMRNERRFKPQGYAVSETL